MNNKIKYEILNNLLEIISLSHENFFHLQKKIKLMKRLIKCLHITDFSATQMTLSILNYLITVIVQENPQLLTEEFAQLTVEIHKTTNRKVKKLFKLINKFN